MSPKDYYDDCTEELTPEWLVENEDDNPAPSFCEPDPYPHPRLETK